MNLYKYQQDYLATLPRSVIMMAETGTGKTRMSLAHADQSYRTIVMAPASKVRTGDWQDEAEIVERRLDHIQSYESLARNRSLEQQIYEKLPKQKWRDLVATGEPYVLICDEVHKIKNSTSNTGRAVYELATHPLCKQFIGLSATPMPNGWQDVDNYGKIFGWWRNKTEFYQKHVIVKQVPNHRWQLILGYRDEDRLKELWQTKAFYLSADQLELPKLQAIGVNIAKPREYEAIRKTRLYKGEALETIGRYVSVLRQSLISEKQKWLTDFLEEADGHTVIFYNYDSELESILASVPKGVTVYQQNGHAHELPAKSEWTSLPERTVTIAHYKSGGTGVEMTYANKIVYFSPTYSYGEYHQSVGRIYRNGQTKPAFLYCLRTPGTIETAIWDAIKHKKDFSEELWTQDIDSEK